MGYGENNTEKPYLMLLNIKVPQAEHARIQGKLNELSNGTSKAIYFDKHGGAFLFKTAELGTDYITFGHESAAGWLRKYINP